MKIGAALLMVLLVATAETASSFSPTRRTRPGRSGERTPTAIGAMERLHHPAADLHSLVEHVYSLGDIDVITRKIYDDEWTALGSVIAETMFETILDVGEEVLARKGWVERTAMTSRIAEEVSSTVEKALYKIRSQPSSALDHGPRPLPEELLTALQTLLRHELGTIINLEDGKSFNCDGRDLSLLVLSTIGEAVESYCGVDNVGAPFFNLSNEIDRRVRDRRLELLAKHSRGYETVADVEKDIRESREEWVRGVMGSRAAAGYEFGEVTTRAGNARGHEKERRAREGRRSGILNALFQDLDGALMP